MLQNAAKHGTGESYCRSSQALRTDLNNTPITHAEMTEFLDYLISENVYPTGFRVFFGRENDRRWGHASWKNKEIIINRRSVQVFLHEAAHITDYHLHKNWKDAHGPNFGTTLDMLIDWWTIRKS